MTANRVHLLAAGLQIATPLRATPYRLRAQHPRARPEALLATADKTLVRENLADEVVEGDHASGEAVKGNR